MLDQSKFPNGKIWYNYWHLTSKSRAYIMHCNWVKLNKKSRMIRDGMWFLDQDDQVCRSDFDPMAEGCQRNCVPVKDGCPFASGASTAAVRIKSSLRSKRLLRSRKLAVLDTWHPMAQRLAAVRRPLRT